jgi:TorA maturation chaperone TorD
MTAAANPLPSPRPVFERSTMKHDDAIAAALANRSFVYTYLWRAFAAEPDEALLATVASDQATEECVILAGEGSRAAQEQRVLVSTASAPDALEALKSDYTRLFIGPGKLPAPPWESVYVAGEDLLFQPSTLEVRDAYRKAGYQATGYPHEADDHLATELGFMEALAKDSQAAYDAGDSAKLRLLLSQQTMFLAQHLNVWLPQFVERLLNTESPKFGEFYPRFAVLARELCAADAAALVEISGSLQ